MSSDERNLQIEQIWRSESAQLMAGLARFCGGDVGLAEELAQDAFVKAIETWPAQGVPDSPGAWLMTTARNLAVDRVRRSKSFEGKRDEIGREMRSRGAFDAPDIAARLDVEIEDDVLRLIFTTCHPSLTKESRVALTLRMLGGLRTDEIARAFLVSESTVGQRISRAKRTLAENKVAFEIPTGAELPERLASVLEVIYLIFNEGYAATSGDNWLRRELCEDAIRLGRMLATLAPDEAEVFGLLALIELQASRLNARVDADGNAILLLEQDRSRWDATAIANGLAALERAESLNEDYGPYTLQAEIAACHARAGEAAATDWRRIAALYGALGRSMPSPVVELNRAVAVGMAFGPQAGLDLIDQLVDDPALANYHRLPSVRGDLLDRLGRFAEARTEFERAASMTRNSRERDVLLKRAEGTVASDESDSRPS